MGSFKKEIWVYVQESAGKPLDVAFELLNKGRELADQLGAALCAVLISPDGACAKSLDGWADRVYVVKGEAYKDALEGPYSEALIKLIEERRPEIVLYGATVFGRSLAPAVAAKVHTGLTADCTMLEIDRETGLLQQTRPAFGGNLMATIICPDHRPQMATVRPGVFKKPEGGAPDPLKTEFLECAPDVKPAAGIRILEFVKQLDTGSIKDADVLFVCGRGIGSKSNVNKVERLVGLIRGKYAVAADFGVSRPLVDTGWAEYKHQVGQTGLSVAPKLLVSLGVSGAIQHLAGISGAKTIVAVNTDPEAPIFGIAHYSVVADCAEIVDSMLAALQE